MKIIGLCGGSGSGKGAVASIFGELGIPTVDLDKIYRELTLHDSECLKELAERFGHNIIDSDGSLNRAVLAKIVFAGENASRNRRDLNSITHKHILAVADNLISVYRDNGAAAVAVDAPLLFESGFDKKCDVVVAVISDTDIRLSRIMRRDNISREMALSRISSQLSDEYLKCNSDFQIINNGSIDELRERAVEIARKILSQL